MMLSVATLLVINAADPVFVTSDPNGGWSTNGYYVHNNMWNSAKYSPCTSTLHAWSCDNWHIVTRMNNETGDGAIKAYPNVHRDYDRVPIGSFDSITSSFAETSPRVGIYNLVDYFFETMAVHPQDCRTILAGTESGIHRSTDRGKTWQWIRDGFPPLQQYSFSAPIAAIAFDAQHPNRVYAGVGRPRWNEGGAGAIYCSDDTGLTWRVVSGGQLPADAIVSDIDLMPRESQIILVATQRGIFRSDDSGQRWTASNQGLPYENVAELAFAPSAPHTVYASLRTMARDKEPFVGGVYRSDDAGKTWREVNGEGMPRRVGGQG